MYMAHAYIPVCGSQAGAPLGAVFLILLTGFLAGLVLAPSVRLTQGPVFTSVLDQSHTTAPGCSPWFWGLNSGPASLPCQLSHLLHISVAAYMSIQCLLVYSVDIVLAHASAMTRLWVAFRCLQQSAPPSPGCKMLIKKKTLRSPLF